MSRVRRRSAFLWSVRRELWENKSVYIAPVAAAAIFLFAFVAGLIMTPESLRAGKATLQPYPLAAIVMMGTAIVVGIFYCLDTLYAERRDRSILFWKSLPVSDRTTVLAKLSIPFIVLPVLTAALTLVLHLVMLAISSVVLWTEGFGAGALWQQVAPVSLGLKVLYHMMTMHVLWYAPIFAWLLLASACARRAPFLWAGIPLLAVMLAERLTLGSSHFIDIIRFRFLADTGQMPGSSDPLAPVNPAAFLASPGLWIGLALAAIFVAATIRIRRYNGPL